LALFRWFAKKGSVWEKEGVFGGSVCFASGFLKIWSLVYREEFIVGYKKGTA
jgi:hypothetical protein